MEFSPSSKARPPLRFHEADGDVAPGGLSFSYDGPERPTLRVELASGRRLALRGGAAGSEVLLYARVAPAYAGVTVLLTGTTRPSPLPPIPVSETRRLREDAGTTAWFSRWARRFAELLHDSPGPLHGGLWHIERAVLVHGKTTLPPGARPLYAAADGEVDLLWPGPLLDESWGINGSSALLPLRAPSLPSSARVKALRKQARTGELAPILALFVTGLDLAVVVDGHDRWHAAVLEGMPPPILLLSSIRTYHHAPSPEREALLAAMQRSLDLGGAESSATVDRINQRLVAAFSGAYRVSKTRCFPFPGGARAWDEAVRAQTTRVGEEGVRRLVQAG